MEITNGNKNEEELIDSKALYKAIFNSTDDAIFILDMKGNIVDSNPKTREMYGYSLEELKELETTKLIHPDYYPVFREALEVMEKGEIFNAEGINVRKDSTEFWIQVKCNLFEYKGETHILNVVRDITESKETERKLRKSEEKYKQEKTILNNIIDLNPYAIAIFNSEGYNIRRNQAFINFFKSVPPKEYTFFEDPIIKKAGYENELIKARKGEKVLFPEVWYDPHWYDPQYPSVHVCFRMMMFPIFSQNGNIIENYVIMAEDITERKLAEEKLKESEEKFFKAFQSSPNMMTISQLDDGIIVDVNEAFTKTLGYERDELRGKSTLEMNLWVNPEDRSEMVRKSKEYGELKPIDIEVYTKSGEIITALFSGDIIYLNKKPHLIAIASDITDRKKAEEKLKESEDNFKILYEEAPIPYFSIGVDKSIKQCNNATSILTGYTKEELLNIEVFNLYADTSDGIDKAKEVFERFLKGEAIQDEELQMKRKDGNIIWISLTVKPIIDKSGKVMGSRSMLIDITERKLAEKKAKESEEKFRTITEQSLMGIAILQDDRFQYVNKQITDMFDYPAEEMMNWERLEYAKLIYLDDRKMAMEQARKKQLGLPGAVIHYEFRGVTKNSKTRLMEIYSNTFNYRGRNADLITIIDITSKREAEEKFRKQNVFLNNIIESLTHPFYVINVKDYKVALANSTASSEGLEQGKYCYSLIHHNNKPCEAPCVCPLNKVKNTKKACVVEHTHYDKEGNENIFEIYGYPIFDENENVVQMIEYAINITDRKIVQQELKKSEEKYRELVETSSMGLLEIDLITKKVSYANPKLLEIIGYSREELNDDTLFYNIVHPVDLREITQSRKDHDLEFRIITKERRIKWLLGRRIFQLNENGEFRGLRLWLQDITEKKILEQLKKEFLDRTSHELKTPLISIKGFTELLLDLYADKFDVNILSMLSNIFNGCERLETLINKILESSQYTLNKIELNKTKRDLSYLTKMCVNELSGLAKTRNITIFLNLHDELITEFESEKIHTVLSNLLINAIKYTQPYGEISIKSEILENSYLISIQDTGIGFTEGEKARLFTQFGKIERYGKGWNVDIDGSGLGLFISKRIIELHNGEIWVESEGRNKGSTFYFSLPTV